MYDQIREDIVFIMFYAVVAATSMIACVYLLFRRANAIAPDVTPPVRLRRWTAAFFAAMTFSHAWYMPVVFHSSSDDVWLSYLVGALLDFMILIPLAIIVLLTMLQDRRRPLWPVAVMAAPPVVIITWCLVSNSNAPLRWLYTYMLLLGIGLIIYMVRAVRQYGRWLRDNYADLEHKEVWQSFVVLTVILLIFGFYSYGVRGPVYQYIIQFNDIVLICYLLWRVETLSELSISQPQSLPIAEPATAQTTYDNIGSLLQQNCIDTQLYLQHDLNLIQLAKAIGTNRFYLSQYFSSLGMSYNAYINDLRINHFISLYHDAIAAQSSFTVQQLAQESGFRSYTTFISAFKSKTGQSVRSWIKTANKA